MVALADWLHDGFSWVFWQWLRARFVGGSGRVSRQVPRAGRWKATHVFTSDMLESLSLSLAARESGEKGFGGFVARRAAKGSEFA